MSKQRQLTGTVFKKEYYDNAFLEIEKLPNSLSPEEIDLEICKRMNLTMIIVHMATRAMLESIELFRMRIPANDGNFDENKIESYYYPPNCESIPMGRANIAKQQVFYGSLDGNTPFHELSNQIIPHKTACYLSAWGLRNLPEITHVRNLFLGIPPGIEDNLASIMATGLTEQIEQMLSQIPENVREDFLYAQKKYSALFTSPLEYYHLSSAIAHSTFVSSQNQGASMPILTYPSVAKNKSSVNMAIRKDYADNHLFLKEVYKVTLTEFGDRICKTRVEKRGLVSEGKILWTRPVFEYKISDLFYAEDDAGKIPKDLPAEEFYTLCCEEHKLSKEEVLEKIKMTNEKILNAASNIPQDLYTDFPQMFSCLLQIKPGVNLYRTGNISESGRIKLLFLALELTIDFN